MKPAKFARITVVRQGDKQTVTSTKNTGGSFVYIKPDERRHKKNKLILRLPGYEEIHMTGRQISSLKKVLTEA